MKILSVPELFVEDESDLSQEQRRDAIEKFLDSWDESCALGISSDLLIDVCLYLALTEMVEDWGKEETARLLSSLPQRILKGEFDLKDTVH